MKRHMLFCIVLVWCFLRPSSLCATHIIGGDITYTCLGNDSFLIKLTVFRDCYNGQPPFDDPASIGVFDQNWTYITQYLVPYTTDDTLEVFLTDPCLQVPPDVCVHRSSYTFKAYLPFRTGGYQLVYQRCCRNKLIRNIIDPEATGASFVAKITEASLLGCNNSSVFKNWPPVAICINQPIDFDHGATDADGDSLVYKLCIPNSGATAQVPQPQPPNAGPYAPVMYIDPPYNLTNVLGGTPLKIDPVTGFLTGVPNTIGNFVVGVCVEEYRNGVLISSTNRDFQYNVADCGIITAGIAVPTIICDTLGVQFQNNSGQGGANYQWFFDWPNQNPTSFEQEPYFVFPDTGSYTVALIANPGLSCTDTAMVQITLKDLTAVPNFTVNTGICDSLGIQISVTNQVNDPVHGVQFVQWLLNGPNGSQALFDWEPQFAITEAGQYSLTITVRSNNGCSATQTQIIDVPIPDLSNLDTIHQICLGDSVALFPLFESDQTYLWSPSTFLSDPNLGNPISTPSANITYQTTITDPVYGCQAIGTVVINVNQTVSGFASAQPPLIFTGQTSQLEYTGGMPSQITWMPPGTLSDPNIINPVASPTSDSTVYTAVAIYEGGCTDTVQVLVLFRSPICADPYVFFPTAFSPNGDQENDDLGVEGTYLEEVYWVIYDRWGGLIFESNSQAERWDGRRNGTLLPPDTYGYYLKVRCIGGGEFVQKGNVTLLK
jgi:gliding motility-associated-like protein